MEQFSNGDKIASIPLEWFPRNSKTMGYVRRPQTIEGQMKLWDLKSHPRKSPRGAAFQRKIPPSTSGGSLEAFNSEFRVHLSSMIALSCSLVCSSKACEGSMSISPPGLFINRIMS